MDNIVDDKTRRTKIVFNETLFKNLETLMIKKCSEEILAFFSVVLDEAKDLGYMLTFSSNIYAGKAHEGKPSPSVIKDRVLKYFKKKVKFRENLILIPTSSQLYPRQPTCFVSSE